VNFLPQHRTCRGQRLRPLNDFQFSTKHLRYLLTYLTEFCRGLARPTRFAAQWTHPLLQETHKETWA